jgi:hypothetical protein
MLATCPGSVIAPSSVVPSARLLMVIRRTLPWRSSRSRPTRARGLVSASLDAYMKVLVPGPRPGLRSSLIGCRLPTGPIQCATDLTKYY